MAKSTEKMEKIVALCKRRGFIFQSSEIYGGINGFWDYGPLGVELKRNIKDAWWLDMVRNPPPGPDGKEFQMVGLDAALIMNPKVWEASGHVGGFSDPMVDCKECKARFRADQVESLHEESKWLAEIREIWRASKPVDLSRLKSWANKKGKKLAPGLALVRQTETVLSDLHQDVIREQESWDENIDVWFNKLLNPNGQQFLSETCPSCGGQLTKPRDFNLMFKTYVGATATEDDVVYLRPETAQGIFANFKNVVATSRVKLPFGIGQIGKAFRNEINP
ncbi:MAG: glycine--tRNA ligase, partial [Planctomycetota bacterium]|nr:glycine--tRNA ligase [Planctomycetota bacterium]